MNADIVVYLEHDGKRLHGEMANLASKASALAKAMDGRAVGALVGEIGDALLDEARGLNCHEVVVVHHPELREYHSQLYGAALQSVIEAMTPHAVLFRHSFIGIELAPALAYRLQGAIISNCLDLEVREGRICALRAYLKEACWGRLSPRGSAPHFFTVQKFSLPGDGPPSRKPAPIKEWTFAPPAQMRIRSGHQG
jgi:electron transfer flavoprotein alpha subunit